MLCNHCIILWHPRELMGEAFNFRLCLSLPLQTAPKVISTLYSPVILLFLATWRSMVKTGSSVKLHLHSTMPSQCWPCCSELMDMVEAVLVPSFAWGELSCQQAPSQLFSHQQAPVLGLTADCTCVWLGATLPVAWLGLCIEPTPWPSAQVGSSRKRMHHCPHIKTLLLVSL